MVLPSNSDPLVISLLDVLSEDWTFSRMKLQDLTMLVRPDVNDVAHCYLLRGFILEKLFRRGGVVTTSGAIFSARLCVLRQGLFSYFFSSFAFRLCASLMSRIF